MPDAVKFGRYLLGERIAVDRDHPIRAEFGQDAVMCPVQGFDPDRLKAEQFDIHGAQDVRLEVFTDCHNGNIVIPHTSFLEGRFVLAIRNDRFGQCIGQPRDMPFIGINPEHRVAKAGKFTGNCATKGSKADHGKASGFQRSGLPAVNAVRM